MGTFDLPLGLSPIVYAILSGIAFYLVVGRMFWDSFMELFYETIGFLLPTVVIAIIFEDGGGADDDGHAAKIVMLLIGSVLCGVWVYFKIT